MQNRCLKNDANFMKKWQEMEPKGGLNLSQIHLKSDTKIDAKNDAKKGARPNLS